MTHSPADSGTTAWQRTHYCGEIATGDVGKEVILVGWAMHWRDFGGLVFVDLRDRTGIAQVVFNPQHAPEAHTKAREIRSEFLLGIRGTVQRRPENAINPELPTGEVEIAVAELRIVNTAKTLPFQIEEEKGEVSETLRLKYRYLDLRRPRLQRNFIIRHRVNQITRNYLSNHGFLELETPFLIKSTPEGARDYLVPSRLYPGRFFALPQSPQIFKQLFMVAGFDRYFQIVRCFRDEDLRADRQPEFTQIDIELSFPTQDLLFGILEGLMAEIFREVHGIEIERPFPRMPYAEALERFGSDKPDIRFGLELADISEEVRDSSFRVFSETLERGGSVRALSVPGGGRFSRREIEELTEVVKPYGARGLLWAKVQKEATWQSPAAKHLSEAARAAIERRLEAGPGDLILIVADAAPVTYAALGALRLHLAKQLSLLPDRYAFLWVTDFPLFAWDETEGRCESMHHPFTAPVAADIPLLDTDPTAVRAQAYDLVLNGWELGGGSIRIHDAALQEKIFEVLRLGAEEVREKFGFLLEALQYGTPPHGGIALGMDRLIALLVGARGIRDVIAFPKTQKATDLMIEAPGPVSPEQLAELGLSLQAPTPDAHEGEEEA